MSKIYVGNRSSILGKITVQVIDINIDLPIEGEPEKIDGIPLKHYFLHSPDGFEWGYGGSGPADLALAILINYFGEDPSQGDLYIGASKAQEHHQDFKWAFISKIKTSTWVIREKAIKEWLEARFASRLFGEKTRVRGNGKEPK